MKVDLKEVSFRYRRRGPLVLEDFNLTLEHGITLARGFSGCGKSTLLRLIAGYLKPNSGEIETDSKYRVGSSRYLRREVGMVFQQMNLLPLASVKRNVSLALRGSQGNAESGKFWLEALGLEKLASRRPGELSGGQIQRASIARALAKQPTILLLDEPTSGLDDLNTTVICNALKEHLGEQVVCCIATHDQRLEKIANNVLDFNSFLPVEKHLQTLV